MKPPRAVRRLLVAASLGAPAAPAAAQDPPAPVPIGAFFHSTAGAFHEDIGRTSDLTAFGLTLWVPDAYDQAQLDAWMSAAEAAGARLVFKFLGEVSPPPPDPRSDDLNLDRLGRVCRMTVEAEDSFALGVASPAGPLPARVADPAARAGITAEGDAGNALRFPAGAAVTLATHPDGRPPLWMRRCNVGGFQGDTLRDAGGVRYRAEPIRVRLRVDEAHGPTLAALRATSPDGVLARLRASYNGPEAVREIRVRDIPDGGYAVFEGVVPFYRARPGADVLHFALEATGLAALVVDRFRFENARAGRLFGGEFDAAIAAQAGACSSPRCVRTYVNDEPFYAEWAAYRHVDSVLAARLGRRALTALAWGFDAEMVRRWAAFVRPAEVLVDPYPLTGEPPPPAPHLPPDAPPGHGLPPYDPATYDARLRAALDAYADDLAGARRAARLAGAPLWLVLQAHGVAVVGGNPEPLPPPADVPPVSGLGALAYRFRPPSPEEARALAFLGVAHGARGFFHFLYKSLDGCGHNGCEAYVGLAGPNHERDVDRLAYPSAAPLNPLWTGYAGRWEAARRLNGRLAAMVGALAGWESAHAYRPADAPPGAYVGLVREAGGAMPAPDVHVGVFERPGVAPAAEARFLVVNRRCGPDGTRSLTLRLPAAPVERTVTDLETGLVVATLPPGAREFTAAFAPGDAHLYGVIPSGPGEGLPAEVALGTARPNPAVGPATVALALPAPAPVRLALYDTLGRRIARLHDGPMEAGQHDVPWDATGLPSGVYVLRATVGDRTLSRLVTVAR